VARHHASHEPLFSAVQDKVIKNASSEWDGLIEGNAVLRIRNLLKSLYLPAMQGQRQPASGQADKGRPQVCTYKLKVSVWQSKKKRGGQMFSSVV